MMMIRINYETTKSGVFKKAQIYILSMKIST